MASLTWQWVGFLFVLLLSLLHAPLLGLQAHICIQAESHMYVSAHSHVHTATHMYMNTHPQPTHTLTRTQPSPLAPLPVGACLIERLLVLEAEVEDRYPLSWSLFIY